MYQADKLTQKLANMPKVQILAHPTGFCTQIIFCFPAVVPVPFGLLHDSVTAYQAAKVTHNVQKVKYFGSRTCCSAADTFVGECGNSNIAGKSSYITCQHRIGILCNIRCVMTACFCLER